MQRTASRFNLTCVIFAGGKSSRMGQDKSLLPFGGFGSLAEYQYRRLSELFEKVYLSAKEAKFDFEADIIEDSPSQNVFAPTAGFDALFRRLEEERVFVLSVDTPFVGKQEGPLCFNNVQGREVLIILHLRTRVPYVH